jgi:solute carrier family 25 S-adenosylmethionine transporter 26
MDDTTNQDTFIVPLVSGGLAGIAVDISLYPIDTLKVSVLLPLFLSELWSKFTNICESIFFNIFPTCIPIVPPKKIVKTRLQAPEGFLKAGGFKGVYNGLLSAAVGSAPGAALFFATYETQKSVIGSFLGVESSWTHLTAAGCGETMACLVRVPTENVKQNLQAGRFASTSQAVKALAAENGGRMFGGFYTGYWTTCMREIPFSFIQFPLWEGIKSTLADKQGYPATSLQSSFAGSFSGGVAAAATTPLDVIKTRLMLKRCVNGELYNGPVHTFHRILSEEGSVAFFKGIVPRVFWISLGGFVFFGAYEKAKDILSGGSSSSSSNDL